MTLALISADLATGRLVSSLATRAGWQTLLLRDTSEAVAMTAKPKGHSPGAIFLDLAKHNDDLDVIRELRLRTRGLPIVALCEDFGQAVGALRAGASDFLLKPLMAERIVTALRGAKLGASGRQTLLPLSEKLETGGHFDSMCGAAPVFRAALAVAARAANSHGRVLVSGEAGTGKETLIHAMIESGPRARGPLKIVNAALTAPSALESLLFGHEKDAFPGAFERHAGTIQQADQGTLVIDEIECLSPALQERLVQFLRDGAVRPIGAAHAFRVDVSVIASTNHRLHTLAADTKLLPELLELLSPAIVELPPLRERMSDIPELVHHFLARFAQMAEIGEIAIDPAAMNLLTTSNWPGNVRQLQTALFRAAVTCTNGMLTSDDFTELAESGARPRNNVVLLPRLPQITGVTVYTSDGNMRTLEEIESDVIRLAIRHYRGRMTEVARQLGIGRSTLYRKLNELGIDNAA